MMRFFVNVKNFLNQDELSHYINGEWEGRSHNIEGYTHENAPNHFKLNFTLKLKDRKTLIGHGAITAVDTEGNDIGARPEKITVQGINFQSSKIINFYTQKNMHSYQGTCVLKGKIDTTDYQEEGNAVGYNIVGDRVVVSYVEFRKINQ